ncbi:MAG: ATPase [Nitrososphaeria archaeon]|nr:ATPase [Nitrososphaeria archaeon]NDB51048.1 ATPase [Nitrosopumilaceae archaeon]NDB87795.1 ATPase [Nitrososphaerota archaeon]NDB46435.1 ATPase [Nitrososphaeria archaeon]NDB62711.1 ATPase [Nitrosopumilaceae archaeon]
MKSFAFLLLATVIAVSAMTGLAFAQESAAKTTDSSAMKLVGAGLAFGLAAGGAGIGLGYVGSAGLAVISENPALQSKVFIFIGMVESIAIYGIVMMFIILGQ